MQTYNECSRVKSRLRESALFIFLNQSASPDGGEPAAHSVEGLGGVQSIRAEEEAKRWGKKIFSQITVPLTWLPSALSRSREGRLDLTL